jgi:hypothetical protein
MACWKAIAIKAIVSRRQTQMESAGAFNAKLEALAGFANDALNSRVAALY